MCRGAIPPYIPNEEEDLLDEGNVSEPVTIQVGINFHRVLDVDVVKSEIDLLTWMRFVWTDTRLAWNPEDYNGLDKMWFWVEDGAGLAETSEIWTPDIELWNQKESIKTSFSNSFAAVDPDGSIFWSRPGHLNPICKFQGLHDFPFDNLMCVIELGSWSYSGKFMRLEPFEEGYSIGGSETSGEAFSEFRLKNITAELRIYPPYPSDPLADWPVLLYTISFNRSWQVRKLHETPKKEEEEEETRLFLSIFVTNSLLSLSVAKPYIRGYLIAQILFNCIGFACFWMPVQSGERLGLAITAMLSAVAADLVVVSKLPSASELTWMQKFSMVSQIYAAFCVLEGVVVSYFYFQTSADLVPGYLRCFFCNARRLSSFKRRRYAQRQKSHGLDNSGSSVDTLNLDDSHGSGNSPAGTFRSAPSFRPRDADDFQHKSEIKHNRYWKKWAQGVDDFSRVLIPSSYVVIVAVFIAQVTV